MTNVPPQVRNTLLRAVSVWYLGVVPKAALGESRG